VTKDYLNINEAAQELGVSIPTIRLKLERKVFPNAHQVKQGKRKFWRIPLSDLIASGEMDKVKTKEPEQTRSDALELEIDRLRTELTHKAELLERADREIATYRQLLFSLETKETIDKRRSLWSRLTGKA
jgi:DNA-binding transcriptional MerR regulator